MLGKISTVFTSEQRSRNNVDQGKRGPQLSYLLWICHLPIWYQAVLVMLQGIWADIQCFCFVFVQRICWWPKLVNVMWHTADNLKHHGPTCRSKKTAFFILVYSQLNVWQDWWLSSGGLRTFSGDLADPLGRSFRLIFGNRICCTAW